MNKDAGSSDTRSEIASAKKFKKIVFLQLQILKLLSDKQIAKCPVKSDKFMVRKFSVSEEARRATAGEMMQNCTRRERAAEEKPDHDSCWDGFQVNQINQIF